MAYILTPGFAGIDLTEASTEAKVPLGTEVTASDGNTYTYVQVDGSQRLSGEGLFLSESGTARTAIYTAGATAGAEQVGFVQSTLEANEYGWVVTKGINYSAQPISGCNADVKLYTSANGTRPDDDPTAHILLQGMRANATGTGDDVSCSSAGLVEINSQD